MWSCKGEWSCKEDGEDDGEDKDRGSADETARLYTILLPISVHSPVTVGNGNKMITSHRVTFQDSPKLY